MTLDSPELIAQFQELASFVDNLERRLLEIVRATMLRVVLDELEPVKDEVSGAISALATATTQSLRDKETDLNQHFENRLSSLNENVVKHVEILIASTEAFQQDRLRAIQNEINREINRLRREVDDLRANVVHTEVVKVTKSTDAVSEVVDFQFYAALEDHFRGSQPEILERQRYYLPELGEVVKAQQVVIDLGCGRGEWLALLRSEGILSTGVDSNPVMVARCRELGLTVEHADLVSYVSSLPDHSAGAITLFQVAEHLNLTSLLLVLRESRRALTAGGKLIVEVPNAKNVRVGSGTFWIDPTHHRPVFPDFLEFLAEYVGFSSVKGVYLNRLSTLPEPEGLDENLSVFVKSVSEALDGPGDFALIAMV